MMSWKSKLLSTVALGVLVSAQPMSQANADTGTTRTSASSAAIQPAVESGILPIAMPKEEPVELAACGPAPTRKATAKERNARIIAKRRAAYAAGPAPSAIERAYNRVLQSVYGSLRPKKKDYHYRPPNKAPKGAGTGIRG